MRNKFFLISVLLVFFIIGLMIVTKVLTFPFSYVVSNSAVLIDIVVILDVIIFFSVIQLERSTLRWLKRDEADSDVNIGNSTEVLFSAILVTLGFNLLGIAYYVISGKSLNESLLAIFFNAFVLLYIIYLIFVVSLFINRRTKNKKK